MKRRCKIEQRAIPYWVYWATRLLHVGNPTHSILKIKKIKYMKKGKKHP